MSAPVESLIQTVLTAEDDRRRAEAAEELARRGNEARPAAVALVRATGDRVAEVRDWATAALEELGSPPADDVTTLAMLTANPDLNIAYWSATLLGRLESAAAAAVPALVDALQNHAAPSVRQRAAWALGQIGRAAGEARPALEQAATGADPRLTRLARRALEQIAAPE